LQQEISTEFICWNDGIGRLRQIVDRVLNRDRLLQLCHGIVGVAGRFGSKRLRFLCLQADDQLCEGMLAWVLRQGDQFRSGSARRSRVFSDRGRFGRPLRSSLVESRDPPTSNAMVALSIETERIAENGMEVAGDAFGRLGAPRSVGRATSGDRLGYLVWKFAPGDCRKLLFAIGVVPPGYALLIGGLSRYFCRA
jgi:hypothetical protein